MRSRGRRCVGVTGLGCSGEGRRHVRARAASEQSWHAYSWLSWLQHYMSRSNGPRTLKSFHTRVRSSAAISSWEAGRAASRDMATLLVMAAAAVRVRG